MKHVTRLVCVGLALVSGACLRPRASRAGEAVASSEGQEASTSSRWVPPARSTATQATATPSAVPARYQGMTLRQREFAQNEDSYFQRSVVEYQNRCGEPIDAEIDWQSFLPVIEAHITREDNRSIYSFCAGYLDHTAVTCTNRATARDAIVARTDSFRCHYGGPNARALQIEGSRVEYAVDFDASNYDAWIDDELGRQL